MELTAVGYKCLFYFMADLNELSAPRPPATSLTYQDYP